MPYTIGWYQRNRVLLVNVCDITLQEVCQINEDLLSHLSSGMKPTHLIIDLSQAKQHPTNVLQLKRTLSFMKHPHLGSMVVIGASALTLTLATILMQLYGVNYHVCKNMNEALAFLRQYDGRLVGSTEER